MLSPKEIFLLTTQLEKSQYTHIMGKPDLSAPVLTRTELQNTENEKCKYGDLIATTSGSTGIPVMLVKPKESILWCKATNQLELRWRKWDLSKNIAVSILAKNKNIRIGNVITRNLAPMKDIQAMLEEIQPSYLFTYPSIINELDLTKLSLKDIKSVGETGGTNYSCEEAGTIALQCPEFSENYHIMENMIVENHPEHGILLTELTNPAITRYALGDAIELGPVDSNGKGTCPCGRSLATITKIYGRIRNMLVLPNGDRQWPTYGETSYKSKITSKIKRHQIAQISLYDLEFRLVSESLTDEEENKLITCVLESLGQPHLRCKLRYVDENFWSFGKFEGFKNEIPIQTFSLDTLIL
jgi:phenylacetate-coenzyme A ligase PaaK-like adenylate-forming protein